MRFNLLGPDLPRENILVAYLSFRKMSNAGWTGIICFAIVVFGVFMRLAPPSVASLQLDALKRQVRTEEMLAAVGATERSELLGFRLAAGHFGEVRDSGYTVAQQLVRVANLWPDPRRVPASLKCYTPSDDGTAVTLSGIAASYDAYAAAIASLQQRYLVIPSESPKGNRYEITLRLTR